MMWKEISPSLGQALWSAYREELLRDNRGVNVHAVASGEGFAETVIGVAQGNATLLRLVTTFDIEWETAPDGVSFTGDSHRINEVTRYYLPVVTAESEN